MIARDGGASLTCCLESARGVADEIVLVDTGSKDDTIERARSAGATVLERPWDDDFAAARNAGLAVARGRFVLLLDCDERLEPANPRALRRALEDPRHVGWFLPVESELAGGERLDSTILRAWRHSDDVRFRFPIHEQVLPDLERVAARTGQRFALLQDVWIVHDGYTPAAIAAHGKVERNLRLFRKGVAQHEDEPYLWYKFADFLRGHGERKDEARRAAERAFELVKSSAPTREDRRKVPFWSELLTILVAARLDAGEREAALALVRDEPPQELGSPHYEYAAALALELDGRFDDALECLGRCVGAARPIHLTAWRPSIAGAQGEALRARILLRKGDARGAIAAAERAIGLKPGFLTAIQLKGEALVALGEPKEALRLLMEEVKRAPNERRLWLQVGALLERAGRPQEARRCLARAEAI
jgi:tetratricopeptide (TPR) repeat protein